MAENLLAMGEGETRTRTALALERIAKSLEALEEETLGAVKDALLAEVGGRIMAQALLRLAREQIEHEEGPE